MNMEKCYFAKAVEITAHFLPSAVDNTLEGRACIIRRTEQPMRFFFLQLWNTMRRQQVKNT